MGEKAKSKEMQDIEDALEKRDYRYEILLGRGSYSRVVKAKHLVDEREYAIKILPIIQDKTSKYNKRELELLTKHELWKQNIVKYYCCWPMTIDNEQFLCIQMELCWVNLEAFIYSNEMGNAKIVQAQGPRFYQQVFPQILTGLDAIHSLGWVHRDITTSNILIANPKPSKMIEINIKIADFGLAREIRSVIDGATSLTDGPKLEELSAGVGNECFRAPELSTQDYDYKVDLYSAGIVLYFLSRYLEDKKQWKSEITKLRKYGPSLENIYHQDDRRIFELMLLLLEVDPKNRPTAMEALKHMQPSQPTETTDAFEAAKTFLPESDADKCASAKREKKFLVKKDGEEACKRCFASDDTLTSLQAEIKHCTSVEEEDQVLRQKTIIDGEKVLIDILSDLDVRTMFQSAESAGKKVFIIVSERENTSEITVPNSESVPEA